MCVGKLLQEAISSTRVYVYMCVRVGGESELANQRARDRDTQTNAERDRQTERPTEREREREREREKEREREREVVVKQTSRFSVV